MMENNKQNLTEVSDTSKLFFSSDWHGNHHNILDYCSDTRKFKNIDEMNQTIIDKYNKVVGVNDTSYILGDLFFGGKAFAEEFMTKLVKNPKYMVTGNHDKFSKSFYRSIGFVDVYNQLVINIKGTDFLLTHRPNFDINMNVLNGHVHQNWKMQKNCLNVGVDVHDFFPINAEQVLRYFGH